MIAEDLYKQYVIPLDAISTGFMHEGNLNTPIKCILFDIYGTLLISASGDIGHQGTNDRIEHHLNELLIRCRIDMSIRELTDKLHNAIRREHENLKKRGVDYPEVQIEKVWESVFSEQDIAPDAGNKTGGGLQNSKFDPADIRHFAMAWEMITNPVYPMPNLESTLSLCRQNAILMGVISNAQFYTEPFFRELTGKDFEASGFDRELIFMSWQHGFAKPSMQLFKAAGLRLENLQISADQTLYVGNDMLKDVFPAKQVGFKTALFAGDKRSLKLRRKDPRCRGLKPDLVITDLIQLAVPDLRDF